MSKRTALVIFPGVGEKMFEYTDDAGLLEEVCGHFDLEIELTRLIPVPEEERWSCTDGEMVEESESGWDGEKDGDGKRKPSFMVDNVWARQRILLKDQQTLLRKARVLVVGAGALGSEVVKNMAQLGVGTIVVVDFDLVEYANLNRGFYSPGDLGIPKVTALARNIERIFPFCNVLPIQKRVEECSEDELNARIWVSALDSMAVRMWLCERSLKCKTPLVDGGFKGLEGRVQLCVEDGPCLACPIPIESYGEVMDLHNPCDEQGVDAMPGFPTLSSAISAVMASEVMKLLLGWEPLRGVLLMDLRSNRFHVSELKRNPHCFICGARGTSRA